MSNQTQVSTAQLIVAFLQENCGAFMFAATHLDNLRRINNLSGQYYTYFHNKGLNWSGYNKCALTAASIDSMSDRQRKIFMTRFNAVLTAFYEIKKNVAK